MAGFRWVTSGPNDSGVGAPFRTIADHAIQVGLHGDGVHIAPLNPWLHISYATTGVNSFGAQVNAGQHLTPRRRCACSPVARARQARRPGDAQPGLLQGPDEEIKQVRSLLTVVGGDIVHDTGELSGRGHHV